METLEQTIMQVERFIRKVAQKFPAPESDDETSQMTDIHVRVSQDSGELLPLTTMTTRLPAALLSNG